MQRSDTPRLLLGALCLLIATGAALLLVLEHIAGITLPGCGEGSPCARAAASAWAHVPVIHWPTAFLGFAYFVGALVAWLAAGARVPMLMRLIVRLGALVSLGFIAVLLLAGYACNYCLTSHLANLAFWLVVERSRAPGAEDGSRNRRPAAILVIVFLAVSLALGLTQALIAQRFTREQEAERQASAQRIAAATSDPGSIDDAAPRPWEGGFTGRYLLGPEEAAVRIVTITDYQCPDCRRIEGDIMELLARYENVSFSTKHFPMCQACNPHATRTLHANACWAARAAEAAGMLRGAEGFYEMHEWLFEIRGTFDREILRSKLPELGYDVETFTGLMRGQQTLARVQADIEEGLWLGIHYTPMVFINGIEMKGIRSPRAVVRTVEEVLAHDPPSRSAAADQPPPARQKYVDDWLAQPQVTLPAAPPVRRLGAEAPRVTIAVWGDYQEPNTVDLDRAVRTLLAERSAMQYQFHYFPVHSSCNPASQVDKHPLACFAAGSAAAAGELGGQAAFWGLHDWMMAHSAQLSREGIEREAQRLGLAPEAFARARESERTAAEIRAEGETGRRLGFRSIPVLYVNGRLVPRWSLERDDTPLRQIVRHALEQAP
jgi:protein-disulfide isomerase/uncharacterized membrane protein